MKRVTSYDPLPLESFKDANGDWLDESEWPHQRLVFVCETEGCSVQRVYFETESAVNVDGIIRSTCGQCHRPTLAYDPT